MLQLRPVLSATAVVPTNESWLRRASDGRPVERRNTKPGSPTPLALGAGTGLALQSNCIGGLLYGWIATPQVTLPCSAVHSCALDVVASAGADIPSRGQSARSHRRCIHASSTAAS